MDAQGADWCEANIETIVGWLAESAKNRGLPFRPRSARWLVEIAIWQSRFCQDAVAPIPPERITADSPMAAVMLVLLAGDEDRLPAGSGEWQNVRQARKQVTAERKIATTEHR